MVKIIRKFFKRFFCKQAFIPLVKKEETENERMKRIFFEEHKMPCCGCESFIDGPRGGIMMNIECPQCGSRFNISPAQFQIIEKIN